MTWVAFELFEVFQIAGVGQQVEVNDGFVGLLEPIENEVGADKAGGAGNEEGLTRVKSYQFDIKG